MDTISFSVLAKRGVLTLAKDGKSYLVQSDGETVAILIVPTTDFFKDSAIHLAEQSNAQLN